jgi:hypothetical protein
MRKRRSLLMMLILAVLVLSATSFGTAPSPRERHHNGPFSLQPRLAYAVTQGLELPNRTAPRPLGITVDGAKNPTLISDERAYTHFLLSTIGNGEKDVARREALLTRAGLGKQDRDAYTEAVAELGLQLPTVMAQRGAALRNDAPSDYQNARERERTMIDAARSRVDTALTPVARAALDAYVQQHVKPHIVIYGGPMHAGH